MELNYHFSPTLFLAGKAEQAYEIARKLAVLDGGKKITGEAARFIFGFLYNGENGCNAIGYKSSTRNGAIPSHGSALRNELLRICTLGLGEGVKRYSALVKDFKKIDDKCEFGSKYDSN